MLWLSICMAFVGYLPDGEIKKTLHYHVYTSCFQIIGGSLSAVINFHNTENKPKRGICVANHTSPIDVLILACDNAYALVSTFPINSLKAKSFQNIVQLITLTLHHLSSTFIDRSNAWWVSWTNSSYII